MRVDRLLSPLVMLAALTPCVIPASAHAAAIYEGYAYPPGQPLAGQNGGTGWGGVWSGSCCAGQTMTAAPGLSFGALAVAPGAAATPKGPTPPPETISIHSRAFGASFGADGTEIFFSFLLRPDADFGFYGGINLGTMGGSDFFVGKSGFLPGTTDPVFNYSLEGGGKIAQSGVAAVAGATVLLVMRAQFHDIGDDVFDLYVNPTPGGALPAGSDATLSLPDIHLNYLFINNASGWTTDELRLGATFADVTPTATTPVPASGFLIVAGLAGIAVARRRGRQQG